MPLVRAIRLGSLHDFDAALSAGEPEFVKRRIYLTLERGRDICLRNLLRRVCLHQGWKDDGQMRKVAVSEFVAAVGYSERGGRPLGNGEYLDRDEVECQLANMIYKVCQPHLSLHHFPGISGLLETFMVCCLDALQGHLGSFQASICMPKGGNHKASSSGSTIAHLPFPRPPAPVAP